MKTPLTKKELLVAIGEEVDEDNVEILEQTETHTLIFDMLDEKSVCFNYSEAINLNWLTNKIYINPKAKHKFNLNAKEIARILLLNLPTEYFTTLSKVYFIYKYNDIRKIAKDIYEDEHSEVAFDYDEFFENQCGLMFWEHNCVFINLRVIEKVSKEVFPENPSSEITRGLGSTVFHEFRHLLLDTNIFLSEDEYPKELSKEENVEEFGNETMENMKIK